MEINLKRLNDRFHMEAANEAGNTVQTDGAVTIGGNDLGMRPMQLILVSLGSCSAIDVLFFLRKMKQEVKDLQIRINAEREQDKHPSLFTDIHLHFQLWGDLNPKKVEKAIKLSMDTYCSVSRIVEKTARITHSFEIKE